MAQPSTSWFVGSIPDYYDRYLVPVHFRPFAVDLAGRIARERAGGAVLETACGTGVLTNALLERLPASGRLVATDLNQPMVDYASRKLNDARIEWKKADASALPFESASFGTVACQFGVMFLPDKPAAVRETRRVLATGGVFAFNTWDVPEPNTPTLVAEEAICAYLGGRPEFFRIPFTMADPHAIDRLLSGNGFDQVRIETLELPISSTTARDYATGLVRGTPVSHELQQRGIELDPVIESVAAALARVGGDRPFRSSRKVLATTARAA
jgi:SAM-dependent methyltransferase